MSLTQAKITDQFEPIGLTGKTVVEADLKYLRIALRLIGVTFILGIYALTQVWPSGWSWHGCPHSALPADDSGCLCDLGSFLLIAGHNCRQFEPHLVHGVVSVHAYQGSRFWLN